LKYGVEVKMKKYKEITLPDNLNIVCMSKREALILNEQVKRYFMKELKLKENDTIIDIGANIGLFSLQVNKMLKGKVDIYIFEPVPQVFSVLQENVFRTNPQRLKAFCLGFSNTTISSEISYFPNLTSISTLYQDRNKKNTQDIKQIILREINSSESYRLFKYFPIPLKSILLNLFLYIFNIFKAEKVSCQLTTLSTFIKKYEIKKINLLKIDVEKSELDVLEGIGEKDWFIINQIIVEVHDIENRVSKIKELLRKNNFNRVLIEQEDAFKDTDIYTIFAKRI
jgi:FkbM family methyltransferase